MIGTGALLAGVLVLIVAVAVFARRTGIAAPLVLVVLGAGLGFVPWLPHPQITPELVLDVVLPPLLYASALNVPTIDLRRNFGAIAGLSVVLVVISAVVSGVVLHLLLPDVGIGAAIAVGAIISPTDAVAATSIGRRPGLPDRLLAVLEGESLVNDASALVLLRSALAAVGVTIDWLGIGLDFVWAVVGAVAIGAVVGWVTVRIRAMLGDPVLTTAISLLVPFLAYFPTEELGASGVLAAVVAGITTNHFGAKRLHATQRMTDATNWKTVQFVLEQGVFLVMGLQLHGLAADLDTSEDRWQDAVLIGLLLLAVLLVVRIAYLAVQLPITRYQERSKLRQAPILDQWDERLASMPDELQTGPRVERAKQGLAQRRADLAFLEENGLGWRGGVVLAWSGMRGVVTLAAAETLPDGLAHRPLLVLAAFTVAIASLLLFGGTLPYVIRLTKVSEGTADDTANELRALMDAANKAALRLLDDPAQTEIDGEPASPQVLEMLRRRYEAPARTDRDADAPDMSELRSQLIVLQQRLRQAARDALLTERSIGAYGPKTITTAQDLLDLQDAQAARLMDL